MALSHGAAADSFAASKLHPVRFDPTAPRLKTVYMLDPREVPVRNAPQQFVLQFRFDERGIVDSVRVVGDVDPQLKREATNTARKMQAWPAVREGCAVPAWYVIQSEVGIRPTPSSTRAARGAPQDIPPQPGYLPPSRSEAECTSIAHGAVADSLAHVRTNEPGIRKLLLADFTRVERTGKDNSDYEVDVLVDIHGKTVPDSIRIRGVPPDGPWGRELRRVALAMEFYPAVREGCAVPGWWKFAGGRTVTRPS